jgi:hypothetical protein
MSEKRCQTQRVRHLESPQTSVAALLGRGEAELPRTQGPTISIIDTVAVEGLTPLPEPLNGQHPRTPGSSGPVGLRRGQASPRKSSDGLKAPHCLLAIRLLFHVFGHAGNGTVGVAPARPSLEKSRSLNPSARLASHPWPLDRGLLAPVAERRHDDLRHDEHSHAACTVNAPGTHGGSP